MMKWAVREYPLSKVIVRAVVSLYHGAKKKAKMRSKLSKKIGCKLVYTKNLSCHHCFFEFAVEHGKI